MVTQSEIIKALEVIKRVCKEAKDCTTCPLRCKEDGRLCYMSKQWKNPMDWELNDQSDWRAFK